jgi:AraC family transcriptional regulator
MQLAAKAVWVIERNLGSGLTLNGIAESCRVSPFHLAHAFGAATGQPAMSYVRSRRLSEAACKLADGAPDILEVALDSGYASHEAFTRAFKEQFGTTPETVKRNRSTSSLALVPPLELPEGPPVKLDEPEIVKGDAISVVGLAERHAFDAPHKIPAQWQRFMAIYSLIERKASEIPVGVSCNLDEDWTFEYVCGVEVARGCDVPNGLQKIAIPAQTYAVFQHLTHVAGIGNTYLAIWNSWLTDHNRTVANGPSIERHKKTFDPRTGEGGVEIWIPLAK